MARLVPVLAARQLAETRQTLADCQYFSVIFDGATRQGELFVFIARFINDDLRPVQRIFSMDTAKYSVDGVALAGLLQAKLQGQLRITPENIASLAALIHDSASVNTRAATLFVCQQAVPSYGTVASRMQ
jgi:hypothetical protein